MFKALTIGVVHFLALSLSSSCKRTAQMTAEEQHEFGKTTVEDREFSSCSAAELRTDFPETHSFLMSLKNHITRSNPKTFTGMIAPENICVVLSQRDTGIGGGAFGNSGRIELERTTLLNSQNDADLAGVLCHELAHVSMQHIRTVQTGPSGEKLDFSNAKGPEHYFNRLSKNTEYSREKTLLDSLKQRQKSIEEELSRLQVERMKLAENAFPHGMLQEAKQNENSLKKALEFISRCTMPACIQLKDLEKRNERLISEKFDLHGTRIPAQEYKLYRLIATIVPQEVFLTWAEREADEVGFELCIRAGFEIESIKANSKRRLTKEPGSTSLSTYDGCRAAIDKILPSAMSATDPFGRVHEIPISNASFPGPHPENCWRLFNLEREALLHAKDFQPFIKNIRTVIPGGLEKAKRELSSTP